MILLVGASMVGGGISLIVVGKVVHNKICTRQLYAYACPFITYRIVLGVILLQSILYIATV